MEELFDDICNNSENQYDYSEGLEEIIKAY